MGATPGTSERKICRRCGASKWLNDFPIRNGRHDGRQSWCRECFAEYDRTRRAPGSDDRKWAVNLTYSQALQELRRRHQTEFDTIYEHLRAGLLDMLEVPSNQKGKVKP